MSLDILSQSCFSHISQSSQHSSGLGCPLAVNHRGDKEVCLYNGDIKMQIEGDNFTEGHLRIVDYPMSGAYVVIGGSPRRGLWGETKNLRYGIMLDNPLATDSLSHS